MRLTLIAAATAADLAQDTMLAVLEALREGRVEHPDRIAGFELRALVGGHERVLADCRLRAIP